MSQQAMSLEEAHIVSAYGIIAVSYFFSQLYLLVTGRQSVIDRMQSRLIDPKLFPADAVRSYNYSKEDKVIKWEKVEEHAARAKAACTNDVQLNMFVGTPHVGHLRKDPAKYWETIKRSWVTGTSNLKS